MLRLENGFVYLWALFSVMLAGVTMAGAAQIWQTKSQREKEAELMFIGEEFRRAIMSYYNSGPKQYPNSLEDLLQDSRTPNVRRHLRKIYLDPITNTPEWGLVRESDNSTTPNNISPANNKPVSGNRQSSASNQTSAVSPVSSNPQPSNNNASLTNNQASSNTQSNNKDATANSSQPNNSSGVSSSISKGITGVYSLSERKPIKKDQFPEHLSKFSEAVTYNGWQFVYKPGETKAPGASGSASTKPSATSSSATSGSPFAPQSATSKGVSPFSPQSSSSANSRAPAIGSPAQNDD